MIEIKKINKKYKNEIILKDISFSWNENEMVGFLGHNGAGKTTIIKSIFKQIEIDSGEILLNGESIFTNENLKKLAFFPDTNTIPLELSTKDFVNYNGLLLGMKQKEINLKSELIFDFLSITKIKNKKLKNLSAGLKKRAIMASVLIGDPKYIIFDEPTANLDIETKQDFINIFKILKSNNISILITSHLIDELQDIIDKLIIIKSGEILYEKSFDKNKEKISEIYSMVSQTKKIDQNKLERILKHEFI